MIPGRPPGPTPPGTPRPQWERQPCDTNESWPFFKAYRDLKGPRRLDRVRLAAGGVAVTMQQLREWFTDHNWAERVKAFDAAMDAVVQEEREAELRQGAREMAADHLALVRDTLELASSELAKLVQSSRESAAHGLLKPAEVLKFVDAAVKLGRLVKGETTENVGVSTDLSPLNPEEEAAYEILKKRGG